MATSEVEKVVASWLAKTLTRWHAQDTIEYWEWRDALTPDEKLIEEVVQHGTGAGDFVDNEGVNIYCPTLQTWFDAMDKE